MAKKAVSDSKGKPWESCPDLWPDEQAFLSKFMRSQIRRMWSKHPVKNRYKRDMPTHKIADAVRMGLVEKNQFSKQTKMVKQCEMCHGWFPASHIEIDHLDGGYGYTTHEEFLEWFYRVMWVTYDDIRGICKGCHSKVNLMQKFHCTEKEIPYHQDRIAFGKLTARQQKAKLKECGLLWELPTNEGQRKDMYLGYLKEKYHVE